MEEHRTHPLESGGAAERAAGAYLNPETGRYDWQPARRNCDCGARATHTCYNERNTMSFICDRHAQEMIDDSRYDEEMVADLLLVEGIQETDAERRERLTWYNLLANGVVAR